MPSSPSSDPVRLARSLLVLSLCLQHLGNAPVVAPGGRLIEALPRSVEARCSSAVSRYVTSQETLVTSIDGLETLLLECLYHGKGGSLRQSWTSNRRALEVASILGVNKRGRTLNDTPAEAAAARALWFRLLSGDRFFATFLELPLSAHDPISRGDADALSYDMECTGASFELESVHVVVSGRIVLRNQRLRRQCKPGRDEELAPYGDYADTLAMDSDLTAAMRTTAPPSWWLLPTAKVIMTGAQLAVTLGSIQLQVDHLCLVVTLHLPYVLPRSRDDALLTAHTHEYSSSQAREHRNKDGNLTDTYAYSKAAALTASRELLSRLDFCLKALEPAFFGRLLDTKAFVPAMVMLLLHVEGSSSGNGALALARPQDLALIERMIDTVEGAEKFNNDESGASGAIALRAVAQIEAEAAALATPGAATRLAGEQNRRSFLVWRESPPPVGQVDYLVSRDEGGLRLTVPSFGIIRIERPGVEIGSVDAIPPVY